MSVRTEPHIQVNADRIATWLLGLQDGTWWSVDGDPLLTERLSFPCPADELAEELQRINKPLLVLVPEDRRNQPAPANSESIEHLSTQDEYRNRVFHMCWADEQPEVDWILAEDIDSEGVVQITTEVAGRVATLLDTILHNDATLFVAADKAQTIANIFQTAAMIGGQLRNPM